jgi:hypothetical protein
MRPPPQSLGAGLQEPLGQLLREAVLTDQRMREQRLPGEDAVAREGGPRRQALVGSDVLDEAEQLGGKRRLLERHRPAPSNPCRDLHCVVVRKTLERPAVSNVHDVHGLVPGRE